MWEGTDLHVAMDTVAFVEIDERCKAAIERGCDLHLRQALAGGTHDVE